MSDKKSARHRRKLEKKAALVRLANTEGESLSSNAANRNSEYTDKIAQLEQQMSGTKRGHDELKDEQDYDESSGIHSSYRSVLSKRRKKAQFQQLPQYYIDQPYLSRSRHKNLLFTDNAPSLSTPIALRTCEVQKFIMYNLFKRNSLYRPRWCSIQFVTSITQMLVVVLEDWSWLDVNVSMPSTWANTHRIFSDYAIRMVSPKLYGGDVEEDLFMVALPAPEVANKQPKASNPQSKVKEHSNKKNVQLCVDPQMLLKPDAFSRTLLLLPFTDLIADGFPVPIQHSGSSEHVFSTFVFSKSEYKKVTSSSPMFAIDCEMVITSDQRLSLASICVVDEKLQTVYKSLVKPEKFIVDYVTRYSGITPEKLSPVTTRLRDVQRELRELLPADAILCGHSLNNDLVALQLYHPYVIDTSVCYNLRGMAHCKNSLKRLASQFLRKEIQTGSLGHCPEEDAVTTMELVLLKLKIDYAFGNVMADGLMSAPDTFLHECPSNKPTTQQTEESSSLHASSESIADGLGINESMADGLPVSERNDGSLSRTLLTSEKLESKSEVNLSSDQTAAPSETHSLETGNSDGNHLCGNKSGDNELISQLHAFNRRNIPQLEVNMFDLVGHQDNNTAVISSNNMVMRPPENDKSVTIHNCSKVKQVLKNAKRALKDGHDMVYCNIARHKRCTPETVKDQASVTDAQILKLWKYLPSGGLFSLVLAGTEHQHGALMFAVKKREDGMTGDDQLDDDINTGVCYR